MDEIKIEITGSKQLTLNYEDALRFVVEYLRNPSGHSHYADYGYGLYMANVLIGYFKEKHGIEHHHNSYNKASKQASPLFMDVCWDLCRRGILRPSTMNIDGQGTSKGDGFSVTAYGLQWLNESEQDMFVPTEPDRFAKMLEPYSGLFGNAFHERAQEAIRCYNAHAYLATCTMTGAAAETILLKISDALGLERPKTEPISKTRDHIISVSGKGVKEKLMGLSDVMKSWRDEGMHHETLNTKADKAYISLAMLLRLAMFASQEWKTVLSSSEV